MHKIPDERVLGGLGTEEMSFHFVDEEGLMQSWSKCALFLSDYDVCVDAPSQLQEVCVLFPVDREGCGPMTSTKSLLLESVYKRLHLAFTVGAFRTTSRSKKEENVSPLPLTCQALGYLNSLDDKSDRSRSE